jgi:hypothetical protein
MGFGLVTCPSKEDTQKWLNTCEFSPQYVEGMSVPSITMFERLICFAGWAGPTRELNSWASNSPPQQPTLPDKDRGQAAPASYQECGADEQELECSKGPTKDYEQSMEDRELKGNGNQAFAETMTERQVFEAEPEVLLTARIRGLRQRGSPVTHVVLFDVQEATVRNVLQRFRFVQRTELFHAIAGAELDATAVVVWERGLHSD